VAVSLRTEFGGPLDVGLLFRVPLDGDVFAFGRVVARRPSAPHGPVTRLDLVGGDFRDGQRRRVVVRVAGARSSRRGCRYGSDGARYGVRGSCCAGPAAAGTQCRTKHGGADHRGTGERGGKPRTIVSDSKRLPGTFGRT